ncbi:MAG TPA: L-seryl-tRNA(Sec) selenium transferase [Solirubrobacteraceae bacterium]|nr:L-seryl-tRNA(Sec) selenium transferase [Solirubrobacteraceae bacterium]
MSAAEELRARLRALPGVERLAASLVENGQAGRHTQAEAISAARAVLAQRRAELIGGASDEPDLSARASARLRAPLRRTLNATGVVIHTNLGRAPLAEAAVTDLLQSARGYANLELDLANGRRGSRDEHVRELLRELTGAEDGFAVNNGAAAVMLAVATLRERGHAVAVSRGQLVEIGGGFRIPDVLAQTGVRLIEVGTTNRTRLEDYRQAIEREGAGAILRVHQSNFRTVGFVEDVPLGSLCTLGVPVVDDVGSGAMVEGLEALEDEPGVRDSVAAGASLVCFSADKLLGGPQGGILVGGADAVAACRRHPLARATRIGRLPLAALAATLALYRDPARARREVPVLAMLDTAQEVLTDRAGRIADSTGGEIVTASARVGGGALPLLELRGPAVAFGRDGVDPAALAAALRLGEPPLVARIADGRVLVDPRTLADDEIASAIAAIREALGSVAGAGD